MPDPRDLDPSETSPRGWSAADPADQHVSAVWPGEHGSAAPGGPAMRAPTAQSRAADEELTRAVLAGMSAEDHEMLRLAFGEELGPDEVAVTLGLSVRAARSRVKAAMARFEARSIALALTSSGLISCPALARLVPPAAAGQGVDDRYCTLVASHSRSCLACSKTLESRTAGTGLFGTLGTVILQADAPAAGPDAPASARSRRVWQRNPMLAAGSAVGVAVIALAALGLAKAVGGTTATTPSGAHSNALPERSVGPGQAASQPGSSPSAPSSPSVPPTSLFPLASASPPGYYSPEPTAPPAAGQPPVPSPTAQPAPTTPSATSPAATTPPPSATTTAPPATTPPATTPPATTPPATTPPATTPPAPTTPPPTDAPSPTGEAPAEPSPATSDPAPAATSDAPAPAATSDAPAPSPADAAPAG